MEERPEIGVALAELVAAFTELVDVLLAGGQVELSPQRIVDIAARMMPRCEHAGVIAVDDGQPRTVASTGPVADHVNAIQFDVGDGPALDVLVVDDYFKADDLIDDPRWPRFGRKVVEACGIRSMISYRLYLGRRRGAVLSFYSSWPHAFDDVAAAMGAIFAAYCSLVLISQALGDEVGPRRAATVQREIGAASGILMATGQLSADEVFDQLQRASQQLHHNLHSPRLDVTVAELSPDHPDNPCPQPPSNLKQP